MKEITTYPQRLALLDTAVSTRSALPSRRWRRPAAISKFLPGTGGTDDMPARQFPSPEGRGKCLNSVGQFFGLRLQNWRYAPYLAGVAPLDPSKKGETVRGPRFHRPNLFPPSPTKGEPFGIPRAPSKTSWDPTRNLFTGDHE